MKKVIIYFSFVFCFINCTDSYDLIKSEFIGSGTLSKTGAEKMPKENLVINDSINWNLLINQLNTAKLLDSTYTNTDYLKKINIDFSEFTVIACFDEFKGQFSFVNIEKILDYHTNIVVYLTYINKIPGPYMLNISQAYDIVKIKKTDKPISFVTE